MFTCWYDLLFVFSCKIINNTFVLKDEDGNVVEPVSVDGEEITLANPVASDQWVRNPDWVAIPDTCENEFYGVYAVYEGRQNVLQTQITDTHSIYWGDGTVNMGVANGTITLKVYNYSTISSAVIVDANGQNYKTVLVRITLANATSVGITQKTAGNPCDNISYWLDILIDCPVMNTFSLRSTRFALLVERIRVLRHNLTLLYPFLLLEKFKGTRLYFLLFFGANRFVFFINWRHSK